MKKKKNDFYFGENVDNAILEMQKAATKPEKNKIFVDKIMPAFQKLISYHYFRTPVSRNEEIMQDCLTDLYEKIDKFDASSHKRGFPYFNVIAKHFFIQELKKQKKQISNEQYQVNLTDYQKQKGKIDDALFEKDVEEEKQVIEFIDIFKENLHKWKDQFQKEQEKKIVDALICLFDNAENIDIYNKKAIFWYLKEMTDLNTKQIASNLNKMKKKFFSLKKKYQKGDI